jgi:thiol-disulfide isomerase/thioredoxin
MDRLSAVIIFLVVTACGDDKPPPITSRADHAKVAAQTGSTAEAFCDKHFTAANAPAFPWPAMTGPVPTGGKHWMWVNVWASWCKPCVEETPRLVRWHDKLKVDLVFVSIDETDDDVTAFRKIHADWPNTLRLSDPKKQQDWFKQIGLDAGAPIPVHAFLDPNGKTRCVRAGEVRDQDYAVVERLLTE